MAASEEDAPFELLTTLRYDVTLRDATGQRDYQHGGWNYRYSSPYYMLDYHRDRLLHAATYFGWDAAVAVVWGDDGLQRLETALDEAVGVGRPDVAAHELDEPKRCRVTLRQDGQLHVTVASTPPVPLCCLLPLQFPSLGFMEGDGPPVSNLPIYDVPVLMSDLRTLMGKTPYPVSVDTQSTPPSAFTHFKTTRRHEYDAARQRVGIKDGEAREVLLVNANTGMVMDGSISTVYIWRQGRWLTPPVPSQYAPDAGAGSQDGTTRRWLLERNLISEGTVPASSLKDGEECWLSNGVRGFVYGRICR